MSEALLPVATGRQVRHYLRESLARRWRWLVATAVVMIAGSVVGLLPPVAIGAITQAIVERRPTSAVIAPVVLLALAAVVAALAAWGSGVLLARTVLPAVAALREDALETALALPIDQVEAGGVGDLVARVSGDVEAVSDAAEGALGQFLGAALTILATLVGLASLDWRLALAGLLAVPIQLHTLRWYLRESRPIYAAGRVAEGRRTAALLDLFGALPTVRAFRLGERHQELVAERSTAAVGYELAATRAATRFFGRLNGAEFLGLGAILLVSFVLVRHHAVTVGAATTAALFFAALFNPINTVLGVFDDIQQAGAGLARLVGISVDAPDPPSVLARPTAPAELAAEAVTFGYPGGPDVLHDVTLSVGVGTRVALVGTSGSGKSTLASLLCGLRHPRSGTVRLGRAPLVELDPGALRREVALITQDTHVFAGTLADNLRLARPAATDEELWSALAAVGADGWVAALPEALQTVVGAGWAVLTAGQAQHVALARVVLLDPSVVILDEATAEAGSDAARALDIAAERVVAGRSAVVVAHRLGQAVTADRVVVMQDGRLVEEGSHDRLSQADGPYAALWSAWTGASRIE